MNELIISIVTWNSEKFLRYCLESIRQQTYKDFKLFIFDNHSTDNTLSIVNDFYDKRFNLIKNDKNIGYCGGHNYVINTTNSKFVLLVNPDIILKNNYIEEALKNINKFPTVGTLCGLLLQDEKSLTVDSAGMSFTKDLRYVLRFHGIDKRNLLLEDCFVDGVDGALPLYKRDFINDLKINNNFFDDMFFAHKEDWDISWRSKLYGWKNLFSPECLAIHPREFRPSNLGLRVKLPSRVKYHGVKNQFILILKNAPLTEIILKFIPFLIRQLGIFFYLLFKERKSLNAYGFIFQNIRTILLNRKIIQDKSKKTSNNRFLMLIT